MRPVVSNARDRSTGWPSGLAGATRRDWLIRVAGLTMLPQVLAAKQSPQLRVLTDWSEGEIAPLRRLCSDVRLEIIRPTHGLCAAALVRRGDEADALLGGPIDHYVALESRGLLAPIDRADRTGSSWVCSRASRLCVACSSGSGLSSEPLPWRELGLTDLSAPGWSRRGRMVLCSPADPIVFAGLLGTFDRGEFSECYASMVRLWGAAFGVETSVRAALARIANSPTLPLATIATCAIARSAGLTALELGASPWVIEGAGLLAHAADEPSAQSFLSSVKALLPENSRGLSETSIKHAASAGVPSHAGLLRDLFESTLGVTQPELREAAQVLARPELAGRPERDRAAFWILQPPPWPPASVTVLQGKSGGEELLKSLAEQVMPDKAARSWLLDSWNRAPGSIASKDLASISSAADGRVAAEPRFRAWLSAEWTTWARQRYRRAVRLAEGRVMT